MVFYSLYFFITMMLSEVLIAFSAFGSLKDFSVFTIMFTVCGALLLGAICSVFKRRAGRVISFIISVFLLIFYGAHIIYQHIFTGFLSISQVSMGGDAITTYWKETLIGMWEIKFYLIALCLPLIMLIVLTKKKLPRNAKPLKWYKFIAAVLVVALLHIGTVFSIKLAGTGAYTAYDVYNDTFVLNMSEKYFGVLQSSRLEIRGLTFGTGSGGIIVDPVDPEPEEPVDPEKPKEYNVDKNLDFAALAAGEKNDTIKTLHSYFNVQKPTEKNEYTGMFKDYNIVMLCCESFSPYLIDAERTPLLYKMSTEGFVFNNYYGTICDNTSNSEYAFLTGLIPDVSLLGKGWKAFYDFNSCVASAKDLMPLTVANQMNKLGVKSYGFHYWYRNYYGRDKSHPNFGYEFYGMGKGIANPKMGKWPTSDLEMMNNTTTKYFLKPNAEGNIDRFGAYYMTFSGHLEYNFSSNEIAKKNKKISDPLGLPTGTAAYVSGNQELEYALQKLFADLEAAGVMDNTLIVLAPDHYPYKLGLGTQKSDGSLTGLSALAGKNLTATEFDKEFNQYKGCLMIWSASMEGPVTIDYPVCELDILPTVSNLMGFEYDSRLLMGVDALDENADHVAILLDRSYITDKIFYNANNGEVTIREGVDPAEVTDEYVQKLNNTIKNKFTVSTQILYNDYYSYIYGKNAQTASN